MSSREVYMQKLKAQLDEWSADFDKWRARAQQASADIRLKYQGSIDQLQTKREQYGRKLSELQETSGDAWEALTRGVEEAWAALKSGFQKARAEFEKETATKKTEKAETAERKD
jgi:hypothetical protein